MPSIQLTDDEARVLRGVLEGYLRDVSTEISNTEKFELRENLKRERDTMRRVIESL
jgi:hypothetical protein